MRRIALAVLALSLVLAAPAMAKVARTPVRVTKPASANATVAGFELDLVRVKKTRRAIASAVAAAVPKGISVYAVVGKQKRSDRVRGVLVVVNRAAAVSTSPARVSKRKLTVNLSHAAVPRGFRLTLKLKQVANVLSRHRAFSCSSYFKSSDLANAVKLAGPRLPNITTGTVIQAACGAAKSSAPFASLAEFRGALNAPSGTLSFVKSATVPSQVDGTAAFNYTARAFSVLADPKHKFTSCAFTAGTCAISSTKGHPSGYAVFTLGAPAPAGTQLPFSLATAPDPTPALPFQFFGFDIAGRRLGPLVTSGPQ
jgi:hypothetical protein